MNQEPLDITEDLIVAFLNGETTVEQTLLIQNWIEESYENKKQVDDLRFIWIESGKLDPKPVAVNIDKAWDSLFARIEKAEEIEEVKPSVKKTIPLYKTVLKIAAVLVPIIFLSYLFFHSEKQTKQLAIVTTNATTSKKLDDGSEININAHSKFEYPENFAKKTREVSLNGEAFFSITPNKAKPFIIHSDAVSIKVVGTSFNVKTTMENVEVYVKTGKVLLYSIEKSTGDTVSMLLIPGNKGIYDRKTNTITKEEQPNENDLFWKTKTMVFTKAKLSEVIDVLQKNYGVSIILKNPKLSELKLTARFENQSIESIFEIIATSLQVEISKTSTTSFEIDEKSN